MAAITADEGLRQYRYVPPSGACRVLLIRHAESASVHADSSFPLVNGQGDYPLHPDGELQAESLAVRLALSEAISAIYVTPLRRTHQTAAPLARRLNLEPIAVPEFRETFLGEWEGGELRRRAKARDPLYLECMTQERWDLIPGAESRTDFDRRLQTGIGRIAAAHPDQTIAAIVHGGVVGQLLARATGIEGFAFARADNASVSELIVDGPRHVLRRFNDTAHLEKQWLSAVQSTLDLT